MNELPWLPARALTDAEWMTVRENAIFECFKWDQQVGDVATLARQPIILRAEAWRQLCSLAEALAREGMQAEEELTLRSDLHKMLGLPWAVRRALHRAARLGASQGIARLIRFDFHFTEEGWHISEGNTDVPGGHNEADGYPELMCPFYDGATMLHTSPVQTLTQALLSSQRSHPGTVGLVHATSYSDDRQVMLYLERALKRVGIETRLLSPADLRWREARAFSIQRSGALVPLAVVVRFFPGEWLPNLPARCGWRHFFAEARTPVSNPATALLIQSKRFPLVWNRLQTPLPTWRALLPESMTPRQTGRGVFEAGSPWLVKPALGRVGAGVGAVDLVSPATRSAILSKMRWNPDQWVVQRRFKAVPMLTPNGPLYPCVGVYTLDGQAAGAYGRLSTGPIVDAQAQDTAVLVGR